MQIYTIPYKNSFTTWMKNQQQTNGDEIVVTGQKPVLDNGIGRDTGHL